jgi:transposase
LEALKELILGKTILFTDNHHWESERIVTAYRSQFHVEESFKQMKNTEFLSFRPMYHWTDQKIKVHAFYCVLAYRLCCLLNKELNIKGSKQTISRMLQYLSEVKEVTTVYPGKTAKKKPVIATMLANLDTEGGKMIELLNLQKKHSVV